MEDNNWPRNEKWDKEIERIGHYAPGVAAAKPDAVLGVAVDDEVKQAYFVPRLQEMVDKNDWAEHITFNVIPMSNGKPIEVRRQQ